MLGVLSCESGMPVGHLCADSSLWVWSGQLWLGEILSGCWGHSCSWAAPLLPPLTPADCSWAPLALLPLVCVGRTQTSLALSQVHAGRSHAPVAPLPPVLAGCSRTVQSPLQWAHIGCSRAPLAPPLGCVGVSWAAHSPLPHPRAGCSWSPVAPLLLARVGRSVTTIIGSRGPAPGCLVASAAGLHRPLLDPSDAATPGACCHSPTTGPVCQHPCQLGE